MAPSRIYVGEARKEGLVVLFIAFRQAAANGFRRRPDPSHLVAACMVPPWWPLDRSERVRHSPATPAEPSRERQQALTDHPEPLVRDLLIRGIRGASPWRRTEESAGQLRYAPPSRSGHGVCSPRTVRKSANGALVEAVGERIEVVVEQARVDIEGQTPAAASRTSTIVSPRCRGAHHPGAWRRRWWTP